MIALIVTLIAGVFVLDLLTPRGWAIWLLYILPLLIAFKFNRTGYLVPIAAAATVLIALHFYYFPPDFPVETALINWTLGTIVLWGLTLLLIQRGRTDEALRRAHDELDQRVSERTAELTSANAYLKGILDASTEVAIIAGDPHMAIAVFNSGAEKMLGYTADEIVGKQTPMVFHLESEVRAREQELTEQLGRPITGVDVFIEYARQGGSEEREWTYVRKDGRHLTVSLVVTAIRDQEGRILNYLGIAKDITARNTMETALKETNAELDAFAYTVAHDLRAPLRALQGFGQALLEDYADRLDTTGKDYLQRIAGAAQRMDTLIEDLLAYSRLSRVDLTLKPVPLGAVVSAVLAYLKDSLQERQAQVVVDAPLPEVIGHHSTLTQVVANLITNAVKYVAPGAQPMVSVWAVERAGCVRLCVEDNGIGIAPEHQTRIFRVFERLHGSETYPGTGVGLAIVKKGMERMGGRSGVESEVGKGSRFWVELPRRSP
jgi:PAS domain S-box-containing protein